MDSFLRFYAVYRSITTWQVGRIVYRDTSTFWKVLLWTTKAMFVALAVIYFIVKPWQWMLIPLTAVAFGWGAFFNRARKVAFRKFYRLYPERIRYFERDHQYLRYLLFREKLESGSFAGSPEDAISFTNSQIDTDANSPVASHPFVSISLATLLAVLGGAAGQWDGKTVGMIIYVLLIVLYFSWVVLGFTRTPQSRLKEFKRFMLWARDEQPDS